MSTFTEKTLAEHLRISDADIVERKTLLGITPEHETVLGAFHETSETIARDVVEELYAHQVTISTIASIIGDSDTLSRLKSSMCTYIVQLFSGIYDLEYVNARLRIGKVHARIGVAPHLYVSTVHRLQGILTAQAVNTGATPIQVEALHKMILFDLELVFDTYIQGLVSEVEVGRDKLIQYAETLENKVAERTAEISLMARADELTGLSNRREFFAHLRALLDEVSDRRCAVTLVFIDIDNFKRINDSRGHIIGDKYLRALGISIRTAVIGMGKGYRYGGDEFCILLRDGTEEQAHAVVQDLTKSSPSDLHFSYGVATLMPGSRADISEFVRQADQIMYSEKALKREAKSA